ncbi:MAG: hypothetical protein MHM6MM_000971 [Cercozoa sp. M6MM]
MEYFSDMTVKDNVLPEATREQLRALSDTLIRSPREELTHWESDTELSLIDPMLFPVASGITRVVDEPICRPWIQSIGEGESLNLPAKDSSSHPPQYHSLFVTQEEMLPAEFEVSPEGSVSIKSYINNLHPSHAQGYAAIASAFEQLLPMFEAWLTKQQKGKASSTRWDSDESEHDESEVQQDESEVRQDESTEVSLRGRRLQVIVQMDAIELTRDKPKFETEYWKRESCDEVNSVGVVVFHSENIQNASLWLRWWSADFRWCQIALRQQRAVVLHKWMWRHVIPCNLREGAESGSLRVLTFRLIDPERRVVSTERVPPQQGPWYTYEVEKVLCELPSQPELPIETAFLTVDDDISSVPEDVVDYDDDIANVNAQAASDSGAA